MSNLNGVHWAVIRAIQLKTAPAIAQSSCPHSVLAEWKAGATHEMDLKENTAMTDEEIERAAEIFSRMVLKALREDATPPIEYRKIAVRTEKAIEILGSKSASAFYRECRVLGIVPYIHGKYYLNDLENAVARLRYRRPTR